MGMAQIGGLILILILTVWEWDSNESESAYNYKRHTQLCILVFDLTSAFVVSTGKYSLVQTTTLKI